MRSNLAFEMRERITRNGIVVFDSGFYSPNDLTNEGQASVLNVWARGQTPPDFYLLLLDMPGMSAPDKTSTLGTISESVTSGTNGYVRKQIQTTDWSAPFLSGGDMMLAATSKTFGPFTGSVPVSHVGVCSIDTGYSGEFFLFISTAYHNANMISRDFVSGESYQVTLRDKVI